MTTEKNNLFSTAGFGPAALLRDIKKLR